MIYPRICFDLSQKKDEERERERERDGEKKRYSLGKLLFYFIISSHHSCGFLIIHS